ncbi:hypothetical protein HanRHA438_Chr17g0814261 [Helianthus annuus]|nr:hypothetical protein HanRHA438_Chr17g0814261 [Helianthus annuus]
MVSKSNDLAPEPWSPQPVSPEFQDSDRKTGKERKRTRANATKEFLTSFYQKRRKQRQRSVDNLDILLHHPQPPVKFQLPPPSVSFFVLVLFLSSHLGILGLTTVYIGYFTLVINGYFVGVWMCA